MMHSLLVRARRTGQGGFTLIELLIVMSLITVLASISLIAYRDSLQRGREAVLKENLFRMREAIDQYHADRGKYPETLEDLVSAGYMRRVPVDPITQSETTWEIVQAEPDPNSFTVEPGVYDVRSGSEGVALDGTRYNEW
jgi:general secretion pathway protein G